MSIDLSERQCQLRDRAQEFSEEYIRPNAMEYQDPESWPWDLLERAADRDLVGAWIDEDYGGRGEGLVEQCLIDEAFSRGDSNIGLALHSAIVGCHFVSEYGTAEQKERWLPPATSGEITTSIGMTEPESGSSLRDISTTAKRDGDEYVINGQKRWVGNGSTKGWIATLCRTDDRSMRDSLSIIVVPSDTEGFDGEPIDKMGLEGNDHAKLTYEGARVPVENRLGEEGSGFDQVMGWLNEGHGRIAVAAVAVGQAQGALDRAIQYTREREQGGRPVSEYQGMRWKLADMKTKVEVARSQVYRAARVAAAHARGEDVEENPIEMASVAKLYASEAAIEVANEAVQAFGGNGFATEYEIEHVYRDVKAGTLYEGTSEILRDTIGKVLFDEL